jgi:hypothetical protein
MRDGRIAGVRGRARDRVNRGRLDPKDLYLMTAECDLAWTAVGQAARGLRDADLVDVVTACGKETATQLKWVRSRIKEAAPQALVVA